MHENSIKLMALFKNKYVQGGMSVLDVGAQDINGSYRPLFEGCNYVGLDTAKAPGVDVVSEKENEFPFADNSFDVVISGQTLEHSLNPFVLAKEMSRILKPGGFACWIAPWYFPVHKGDNCPYDCWRILEDGMRQLMKESGLDVLESFQNESDTIGIGKKVNGPS